MVQSTLEDPYRLIFEEDGYLDYSDDGLAQLDYSWTNTFPVDVLDYQAGQLQFIYELSLTFAGTDQNYIGQVIENPTRRQFGSYCFAREGFIEADSRGIFEYDLTRLVWRSEIYNLSANQASRPKTLQLGALPIWEIEPLQVVALQTYGQVEPVPLTGRSVGTENGWGGPYTEGGDLVGVWSTDSDAEIAITKRFPVIPTSPLETTIAKEQLRLKLEKAEFLINEKLGRYQNSIDLGTITMYRERSKILLTFYQGVSADFTFKIYQSGLYRELNPLPIYPPAPDPPPGGGA
jgi:hypothetical protein